MGVSRNIQDLAAKLASGGSVVEEAAVAGVAKAALVVKKSVQAELHGVTRLRGVGKSGGRIGVRYDVTKTTAVVRMTGPAQLIENDTKAHEIGPKGAHAAIRLADGSFRRAVHHLGTRGKHPFAKGVEHATPLVPRAIFDEQVTRLRKVFG